MKILVIIVTYNGMSWIQKCLNSIDASELQLDTFIVDNGSTDGTIEFVKQWARCVSFVESNINLGFGKANNIGMQYALDNGYDFIYLLNQDAWIFPDTIGELIKIQQQYPDFGILSPAQIKADERHFESIFLNGVCPRIWNKNLTEDLYFNELEAVYEVPDVMAAHWLISIDCLRKVGGFSPIFPHYGEDDNYVNRARFHGFKVGFVPGARAVHDADAHPADRKKQVYLSNIYILNNLVKIWDAPKRPYLLMLRYAIKSSFLLHSIKPCIFYLNHVFNYKSINKIKKQSKSIHSFLE